MVNLSVLRNLSGAKKYTRGSIISKAGTGTTLYLIVKGEVGIYGTGGELIVKAGPGDFFDEESLFGGSTAYTATAVSDVITLPVKSDMALNFIRDEPEAALEILKDVCQRLACVSSAYEALGGRPFPWREEEENNLCTSGGNTSEVIPQEKSDDTPSESKIHTHTGGVRLFPDSHGSYSLDLHNDDSEHLMSVEKTCPICREKFKVMRVRASKLMPSGKDNDMRVRYKGIEPIYYGVVTCPKCHFSAISQMFESPERHKADLLHDLADVDVPGVIQTGTEYDSFSVFAGYYLALFCAPRAYSKPQLATAKLLLDLSRIYSDAGDAAMEAEMAERALEAYNRAYESVDLTENQDQQICMIIGGLYLKLNDLKQAKQYFFRVKMNKAGTPVLRREAETKLDEIREAENAKSNAV